LKVKVGGTYGDHCALNSVSSVGILFSLGWQSDKLIGLLEHSFPVSAWTE